MPEQQTYLSPTEEAGRAFWGRASGESIVMLNLLRFRAVADYAQTPTLQPSAPISGTEAYRRYMEHTRPHLAASGGEILFFGHGGAFLIGPSDERWDAVMLVRQANARAFLSFATNEQYLAGMGHRLAALEDARLLPIVPETV